MNVYGPSASRSHRGAKRRGATLGECSVALIVLATALAGTAQLAVAIMAQQRLGLQQHIARQEAANLMEQAFALPDEQLTAESLAELALSDAAQRLSGVRHSATIGDAEGSPAARRIVVEVQWMTGAGRPARPIRLCAWRFGPEGQP